MDEGDVETNDEEEEKTRGSGAKKDQIRRDHIPPGHCPPDGGRGHRHVCCTKGGAIFCRNHFSLSLRMFTQIKENFELVNAYLHCFLKHN